MNFKDLLDPELIAKSKRPSMDLDTPEPDVEPDEEDVSSPDDEPHTEPETPDEVDPEEPGKSLPEYGDEEPAPAETQENTPEHIVDDPVMTVGSESLVLALDNSVAESWVVESMEELVRRTSEIDPQDMQPMELYLYCRNAQTRSPVAGPEASCQSTPFVVNVVNGNEYTCYIDLSMYLSEDLYMRRVLAFFMGLTETDKVVVTIAAGGWTDVATLEYLNPLITAIEMCLAHVTYDAGHVMFCTELALAEVADTLTTSVYGGFHIPRAPSDSTLHPCLQPSKQQWFALLRRIYARGWITAEELDESLSETQGLVMVYGDEWMRRYTSEPPLEA